MLFSCSMVNGQSDLTFRVYISAVYFPWICCKPSNNVRINKQGSLTKTFRISQPWWHVFLVIIWAAINTSIIKEDWNHIYVTIINLLSYFPWCFKVRHQHLTFRRLSVVYLKFTFTLPAGQVYKMYDFIPLIAAKINPQSWWSGRFNTTSIWNYQTSTLSL